MYSTAAVVNILEGIRREIEHLDRTKEDASAKVDRMAAMEAVDKRIVHVIMSFKEE